MEFQLLLEGLVIGFSIAAPVGPVGVLCIRRTLSEGRAHGLASGLGAASADAIYASIAGFGLTFVSNFLIDQLIWLRIIGGLFLCLLGVRTFFSKPAEQQTTVGGVGLFRAYASTFFLTLTNPMTILSFASIFAGLAVGTQNWSYASSAILIFGVFAGSALWWFVLSGTVNLFRTKLKSARLRWVNRISGMIIAGFGVIVFLSLVS